MILHVDMDAFYASVEERENPELTGKPVIVGGTPEGRGVVAAANYVVRQYGVHSAMPTSTALRLCPHAVVLPSRMDDYAEVSWQIRAVFARYTPLVEPIALDEAFLDVTGSEALFGPAAETARTIKDEIRNETALTASVGVAPNKFLAKLASDFDKPDGLVVVAPDHVQSFLDPLSVSRLWGVGRTTGGVFEKLGVRTIADLRRLPLDVLHDRFGKAGDHLWQLARGIDDRPVIPDREAKSLSHETTFATDIADTELLRAWLLELTEQVGRRLRRHRLRGRTVQIKVRYADFRTVTRAHTLPEPTNATRELWQAAVDLLTQKLPEPLPPVRLLGMGVGGIDRSGTKQGTLFEADAREKQAGLDEATDRIRERFGKTALRRGSHLEHDARHAPPPRADEP